MIIEIALGIVLAVLILRFLPLIVVGALFVGALLVALVIIALIWANFEKVAPLVGAVAALAVLYGIPLYLQHHITKKYPNFGALVRGEAPYNQLSKQPIRLTVMALFAVSVAGLGVGALIGSISAAEYLVKAFGK